VVHAERGGHGCGVGCVLGVHRSLDRRTWQGLHEAEHHRSHFLAACGGGLNVRASPSAGASRRPSGQGLEDIGEDLLGDGGGWELVGRGCWWWQFLGVEGAEGGAHLLCWGQDGLGVEGPGGLRDATHDKAAVDAGGCAVVFRAVGCRWRGGRFDGFVLERVGVLQALQPPSRAAGTLVGMSV
jgi:hypothetical protein